MGDDRDRFLLIFVLAIIVLALAFAVLRILGIGQ